MERTESQPNTAMLGTTPETVGSQTVGPYYAIGLDYLVSEDMAPPAAAGDHVTLQGTVFDADGEPVPDCILEFWQAGPDGHYPAVPVAVPGRDPATFSGFSRISTHNAGRFTVHTVVPGPVPFPDGRLQAPHLVVLVFMRGLMRHLVTRVYLPGSSQLAADPVLTLVPEERRSTLVCQALPGESTRYQWNIRLQGARETVFFAC